MSGLSSLMSGILVVIWILPFGVGLQLWLLRVRLVISRLVFDFCPPSGFSWPGSCG